MSNVSLSDEILQSSENDKEHTHVHDTPTRYIHARTRLSREPHADYTQTLLVMIPVLRVHVRTVCPCYPAKTTSDDKLDRSIVRQNSPCVYRSRNRYFYFHRPKKGRSRIGKRQVNFFFKIATRSSLILRPIVPNLSNSTGFPSHPLYVPWIICRLQLGTILVDCTGRIISYALLDLRSVPL